MKKGDAYIVVLVFLILAILSVMVSFGLFVFYPFSDVEGDSGANGGNETERAVGKEKISEVKKNIPLDKDSVVNVPESSASEESSQTVEGQNDSESSSEIPQEFVELANPWGACNIDVPDDSVFLLNVSVENFTRKDGKQSFVAKRGDVILRENSSTENFYIDNSGGNVSVDYEIVPVFGGVDIKYTISNPTSYSQKIPEFRVEGIKQTIDGDLYFLDTFWANSGNLVNLNKDGSIPDRIWSKVYPVSIYSPVFVTHDNNFAVGTSLQYNYMSYKHAVRLQLWKNGGSWVHRYYDFEEEGKNKGKSSLIQPGKSESYTLSVRFSEPKYWLFTLHPYKKFFGEIYCENSVDWKWDRSPVRGDFIADGGWRDADNPRAFNRRYREDLNGWQEFVDNFINSSLALGYNRTMLWLPSGTYQNPSFNFPPAFMDWTPEMIATEDEFAKFSQNGIKVGFWWGRSAQIPNPQQWNPESLSIADLSNQTHLDFLTGQLNLAKKRKVNEIGLDAFTIMPDYEAYNWVDEMKKIIPGVFLVHEAGGSDIMHSKIANFYFPRAQGNITGPDVLSRYLNGDAEIWVFFPGWIEADFTNLQKHASWGYTILPGRVPENVSDIDLTIVACFDGEDNDGDGLIDWPYDSECLNPADNSEEKIASSPLFETERKIPENKNYIYGGFSVILVLLILLLAIHVKKKPEGGLLKYFRNFI